MGGSEGDQNVGCDVGEEGKTGNDEVEADLAKKVTFGRPRF